MFIDLISSWWSAEFNGHSAEFLDQFITVDLQDWLLVSEALLRYADSRPNANTRSVRARELTATIAVDQDLRTTDIHYQIDHRWP